MTKTEKVYGGSLYDLAKEEGVSEEIGKELTEVLSLFDGNPDYWRFLSTLSIPKQERSDALDEAFRSRIHPYLLNFMKILSDNGTMGQLKGCAKEYRSRYNEDNGIVEVCAKTAIPMDGSLQAKLKEKLESVLGKTVELSCRVDTGCIGGVLLELPGRQLDGTVKHRLDALSQSLRTVSL